MLNAAEDILREEGYALLTSRRVAERAGVKQRLVYYYFRTMDDLIVETFRRLALRELERLTHADEGRHPLRQIWDVCIDTQDTRLVSEFMALANRNDALRLEVKRHIEACREAQVTALARMGQDAGSGNSLLSPAAVIMLATGAAIALHREAALGISVGHAELVAAIDKYIAQLD